MEKEKKKEVDFSSIQVMARLTDTKIDAREICDKWLLITYDIPCTEAGNIARREFLNQAYAIGATRHTDSVYLMPWTATAEALALQLARIGDVCVWTSQTTDEERAKIITENYDSSLESHCDEVSKRLDKMGDHLREDHQKQVDRMSEKTRTMLTDLEAAITRRGSHELMVILSLLKERFRLLGY